MSVFGVLQEPTGTWEHEMQQAVPERGNAPYLQHSKEVLSNATDEEYNLDD
jgi:hypothetical protein